MSKILYHCNKCETYVYEPEVRSVFNPHPRNVCPCCGIALESTADYTEELVTDSFYDNTPKLRCYPNYLN